MGPWQDLFIYLCIYVFIYLFIYLFIDVYTLAEIANLPSGPL